MVRKATASLHRTSLPKAPDNSVFAAGFAKRLGAVLDAAGVSINAFAKQCGIRQSTLSHYFNPERGKRTSEPTLSSLVKIARSTGISLDWLAAGTGDGNYVRLKYYDLEKSQGYNEAFISRGQASGESRLFDLSTLDGWRLTSQDQRLPIAGRIEVWQRNPARAQSQLFMALVGGSGEAMAPLIRDGDLVVAAERCDYELDRDGRPVSYPCLASYHGKVIIRLVRHEKDRSTFGLIETKSGWPPKMASNAETVLRVTAFPRIGEYFLLGRVIWCGRSLLSLDFS